MKSIALLAKASLVSILLVSGLSVLNQRPTSAQVANLPPSVCAFPANRALLSYAEGDAVYPAIGESPLQLSTPIPAGTYTIVAESYEDHIGSNDPTQADERWQFIAYSGNTEVYRSDFTDDIPDDQNSTTTTVGQSVTLPEVTAIRYAHIAYTTGLEADQFGGAPFDSLTDQQKAMVEWHSVEPSCIEFTQEDSGQIDGANISCDALNVSETTTKGVFKFTAQLSGVADTASLESTFTATRDDNSQAEQVTSSTNMAELALTPGSYTIDAVIVVDGEFEIMCQTNYTVQDPVDDGAVLGVSDNQGGGNQVLAETGTARVAAIIATGLSLLTAAIASLFASRRSNNFR